MDEMMEDMLDAQEDEEIEQEADAEVDKVLFDLTNGKLGQAGTVGPSYQYVFFLFLLVSC
jgi:charged multivesicular body protein 3